MNEILQKRLQEAAKTSITETLMSTPNYEFSPKATDMLECAYIKGAEDILKNQWISVDEALPPIREKDIGNRSWSDWVLIMTHDGRAFMDCYAFHRKEWLNNGNDVTHWCPIPQLKGGEE